MGADGFRLDAIKHIVENGELQENTNGTHEWLQGFTSSTKMSIRMRWRLGKPGPARRVLKYTDGEVDIAFQFDLANALQ